MSIFDYGYDKLLNKGVVTTNPIVYDQFTDSTQLPLSQFRAITSNIRIFDAVVDRAGNGDYISVKKALDQGKTRIFVRNGTYNEETWTISNANTIIVGESYGGVIVTFTSAVQGIALNASNVSFQNLDLNGTQASTVALIKTNGDKTGCSFDHCIFDDAKTYIIDAFTNGTLGSQINFTNCVFEGAGMSTGTVALYGLYNCLVTGCTINLDVAGGLQESVLLGQPRGVSVVGNAITGDFVTLATNVNTLAVISQNVINARNVFCATTNFTGNYVFANADPGSVAATRQLFTTDGASRVSGNYFEMNYNTRTIFEIGNFTMVNGNTFVGGATADIIGEGVTYVGNLWSATSAGNVVLTLTAASSRCIYGDSIIKGGSTGGGFTATLTDSGTNNVISADRITYTFA